MVKMRSYQVKVTLVRRIYLIFFASEELCRITLYYTFLFSGQFTVIGEQDLKELALCVSYYSEIVLHIFLYIYFSFQNPAPKLLEKKNCMLTTLQV